MNKSKIEWCDYTWNPVTGCRHGCKYCYAEGISKRFGSKGSGILHVLENPMSCLVKPDYDGNVKTRLDPYPFGFDPTFHKYRLDEPGDIKKGRNIFVVSMGDLFGEWVPQEWINAVFDACGEYGQHQYLFLTKNPTGFDRAIDNHACEDRGGSDAELFYSNMWFGTSITCQDDIGRVGIISELPEGHRFLSIEPLHGPIKLNLTHINWVIIGAESGNRHGKIIPKREWVTQITEECDRFNVPVFMKGSLLPIMGEDDMRREFPEGLKR